MISLLNSIPRKLRIVLGIILFTLLTLFLLNALKPEAKKQTIPETIVKVNVTKVEQTNYPIIVETNGTVEASTRGNMVSQIRGEIVKVADNFNSGGSFKKGDVLIEIDNRDYRAESSRALAVLSQAQARYSQQQANAKQAKKDWKRLGNTGSAPDLVLRKPQLAAAQADKDSAQAAYSSAKLNLSRTKVKAPYDGRIVRRNSSLGQYVSVGTVLAEIFSTDGVEVNLPLSQAEFNQLGLDTVDFSQNTSYPVTLVSNVGSKHYEWQSMLTRADSIFDINTRQINVIASVIDPFGRENLSQPAIKIGQFVKAIIHGNVIENALVIPNKAIREGHYVFVAENGILKKRNINILWQDSQNTVLKDGLALHDLVVTTSLNNTLTGTKVVIAEQKDNQPETAH